MRNRTGTRRTARQGNVGGRVDAEVRSVVDEVNRLRDRRADARAVLQGHRRRAGRQVQVRTRTEGRGITHDNRTAQEVGVTGVSIGTIQDHRATTRDLAGSTEAQGTSTRDDARDRQGRALCGY